MGIPFECELCHFRNMVGRDPDWLSQKDNYTLMCIRRANLDAMWSREPNTVKANLSRLRQDYIECVSIFPFPHPIPDMANHQMEDRVGMKSAVWTLEVSRRGGKNAANVQWGTVRKTPTWMGNLHDAGANYSNDSIAGGDTAKKYISDSPVGGKWFQRFMHGMKLRMGVIRIQNEALTSEIVLAVDEVAEREWRNGSDRDKRMMEGTMVAMLVEYGAALRGEELQMVRVEGVVQFGEDARASKYGSHTMWALQGKFKAEKQEQWHCLPIADETKSNLPFRKWFDRMEYRVLKVEGRKEGWYFTEENGSRAKFTYYDASFKELITKVKELYPRVILPAADVENFSLWRSPRRGAITTATVEQVDVPTMELIARWRSKERAKGTEAGLSMRQVYTDQRLTVRAMLRFSKAL